MKTVQVQVNDQQLIQNLRFAFTNGTTLVSECLQNCRRAGATRIEISNEAGFLTFIDNGCGIEDLQALFQVAESGWNQVIVDEEHPFGMGFLSCLFAAEWISVDSRGQCLACDTQDLVAQKVIPVGSSDWRSSGTRLILKIELGSLDSLLATMVQGFPVRVSLNGRDLPRPDALDSGRPFREYAFGQGDLVAIGVEPNSDGEKLGNGRNRYYLQGLPVAFMSRFAHRHGCNVVHLDSRAFFARMPDRECLIDQDRAVVQVEKEIKRAWRARLKQVRMDVSADVFVNRWYRTCVSWGCRDLLNTLCVLPGCRVFRPMEAPKQLHEWEDLMIMMATERLTQNVIAAGAHRIALIESSEPTEETLSVWMYAYLSNCYCVDASDFHADHWLFRTPGVARLNEDSITVRRSSANQDENDAFSGICGFFETKHVDALVLDGPFGRVESDVECLYLSEEALMVCPARAETGEAVRQVSLFTDECDSYREDWADQDIERFEDYLLSKRVDTGERLMQRLVRRMRLGEFANLNDTSYRIQIGGDGVTVVQEA